MMLRQQNAAFAQILEQRWHVYPGRVKIATTSYVQNKLGVLSKWNHSRFYVQYTSRFHCSYSKNGMRRCCQLGTKLAKHGYTECLWSSNLVENVHQIDNQWMSKSARTGAKAAPSLISIRLLNKCQRFKSIFNKCCTSEKIANENFLKKFMIYLKQVERKLRNKITSQKRLDSKLRGRIIA